MTKSINFPQPVKLHLFYCYQILETATELRTAVQSVGAARLPSKEFK